MAYTNDVKNEFIARRGLGESYHTISVKLGVSEKTLKLWGGKYVDQIRAAKDKGLDVAIDLHNLARSGRLQAVGEEIFRIDAELLKRDLSSIPTSKLIMLKFAGLELAGKIIGPSDGKKEDNSLSPWEVMTKFLSQELCPDDDDGELEKELITLRMEKYGGSSSVSNEK
jgi:hypothetical protein